MASNSDNERFACDFELPIVQLEEQIRELTERAAAEHGDLTERVEELEQKRDRLLEETFQNLTAYQRVQLARHPLRPQPIDYIEMLMEDFIELHGDRRFGDDGAVVTGFGRLDEHKLMIIAQRKGKDTKEKMAANFGMPQPEGYRKALHKMKLAEKLGMPVVCLIDTPGAAPAVEAEERGQAVAIAENIYAMSGLRTPIVLLVTGEGCSGGALGIGVGDRFGMLENAYYGVISPEGMAAILWKEGSKAPEAAEAMNLTARDMHKAGIIDSIVPEPLGGAHRDPQQTARAVESFLSDALDELSQEPIDRLLEERYQRYRRLGVYREGRPATTSRAEPAASESQSI